MKFIRNIINIKKVDNWGQIKAGPMTFAKIGLRENRQKEFLDLLFTDLQARKPPALAVEMNCSFNFSAFFD